MAAAHGEDVLMAAVARAVQFKRFRARDVRSILAAGTGVPRPRARGDALIIDLPAVATEPAWVSRRLHTLEARMVPWTRSRCLRGGTRRS